MSSREGESDRPDEGWPNLFLVGAAKAGTTSLHHILASHPAIHMSSIKEPHFFATVADDPRGLTPVVRDEARYRDLFEAGGSHAWRGESSPSYLWDPEAADRIHRRAPQARILVMLRDPVDRAHSHFLMAVREGLDQGSFAQALDEDAARPVKGWGVSRLYRELGQYAAGVERFIDAFGRGNVHVTFFEDFRSDPDTALASIARFLDLDPSGFVLSRADAHRNPFAAPRGEFARRVMATRLLFPLRRRVPSRWKQFARRMLFRRTASKPELDGEVLRRLTAEYAPDVKKLARLLGTTVPWERFPPGAQDPSAVSARSPRSCPPQ